MKRFRRQITWILFILTLAMNVSDLLHCLPGCSHYIRQPDGSLILAGRRPTDHSNTTHNSQAFPPAEPSATNSLGSDLPILDIGECAICATSSLTKQETENTSVTTNHFLICLVAIPNDAKHLYFEATIPSVRGPPSLS